MKSSGARAHCPRSFCRGRQREEALTFLKTENLLRLGASAATNSFPAIIVALSLWLTGGCSRAPDATFTLEIQPRTDNPVEIEAIVTASDARVWARLKPPADAASFEPVLNLRAVSNGVDPQSTLVMSGAYAISANQLRFQPNHPLLAGQQYQARFNSKGLAHPAPSAAVVLARDYTMPTATPAAPPRLTAIYPTAATLPANHLKFYLLFSEPMRQGDFLRHLKLLDATGREVPEPFRETELWSADGQRLTLWFHPGRQKTGVNLNVEIGPILEAGGQYQLVVSGGWPSQRGTPLGVDVKKLFTAGPAGHGRLDMNRWQLTAPRADTRESLRCTFPEPIDWALLQNQLHAETATGQRVAGSFSIAPDETAWSFTPAQPWSADDYRLAIGTVLEDLAGNSVAKPFEVDTQAEPPAQVGPVVYRAFTVK